MQNNLQADRLLFSRDYRFVSTPIKLDKKDIKALKKGSFLEIDSQFLYVIDDNNVIFKLISEFNYIFALKVKDIKKKEFKKRDNTIVVKLNTEQDLVTKKSAISKAPTNVTLAFNGKDLAYANLYITDKIYLEIKEVL